MRKLNISNFIHKSKKLNDADSLFTNIYLTYFETLCYFAHRFFNDHNEASDTVQGVMLKLWEQKEKISEIESIKNYLFRSVYNACINKLEHIQVRNSYISDKRKRLLEIELEGYEQDYFEWDIHEEIIREVAKLTPKTKNVFEMRYLGSMSYKEIAEELNISERTVETHLQNALKILRTKLKKFL